MNNLNNHSHPNRMMEKDFNHAVTAITMPEEMAGQLLENCRNARHSKNLLFRYSRLIAAALIAVLSVSVCSTSYAAYNLYQTRNLKVFFEYDISQEKLENIGKEINAIPGVYSIRFESADEAWTNFQKEYLSEGMYDLFPENPLKNSFNYHITLKLDADTEEIKEQIGQLDGVRRINDLNELKEIGNQD